MMPADNIIFPMERSFRKPRVAGKLSIVFQRYVQHEVERQECEEEDTPEKEVFEEFTDTLFAFVFHGYFSVLMNLLLIKVSSSVTRKIRNPIAQP